MLAIHLGVYLWDGGGFFVLFLVKGFAVNAAKALNIDGKGLGLFVARMRRWMFRNPGEPLEAYLDFLTERGWKRWNPQKTHAIVDWYWAEEATESLTENPCPGDFQSTPRKKAGRSKATALPAPGPLVMLAVAVLMEVGLVTPTPRNGSYRVHLKQIRRVADAMANQQ